MLTLTGVLYVAANEPSTVALVLDLQNQIWKALFLCIKPEPQEHCQHRRCLTGSQCCLLLLKMKGLVCDKILHFIPSEDKYPSRMYEMWFCSQKTTTLSVKAAGEKVMVLE
ncbi:hypothetical protein STEG23_030933 [Scotinomys teguina]